MENELRQIGRIDNQFHADADRERCMQMIECIRTKTLYPHPPYVCTQDCKKRGEKLQVYTCIIILFLLSRMWQFVGYWWHLEVDLSPLHAESGGKFHMHVGDSLRITTNVSWHVCICRGVWEAFQTSIFLMCAHHIQHQGKHSVQTTASY